jgi:Tfp pilus assembly protein FimT
MQTNRTGASLIDLLITITLLGTLLAIALPSLRDTMSVLAVRAARETAFGMFARARIVAQQQGGADILLDPGADRIAIRSASGTLITEAFFAPHGVDVRVDDPDTVTLRYDSYGLGRMMSRTIRFVTRGDSAGLTVSSFGRVRRW